MLLHHRRPSASSPAGADGAFPDDPQVFIARQPILDADGRTFGYELLYRSAMTNDAGVVDPELATRAVVERAFLHWGMEHLIGDRFGLINTDVDLLVQGLHRALPPESIIFELRADEEFDELELQAVFAARRDGYHFALDGCLSVEQIERTGVLPAMSMIKVDVEHGGNAGDIVSWVRRQKPGILTVGGRVTDHELFELANGAGFDLFQGYYFARPQVLSKSARPANAQSALALLAEIHQPDVDLDRIENLVGTDPTLAYRVLAVVNSSAFGLDRQVESLRHAIVLLGLNQVRYLAALLALSTSSTNGDELITLGASRARFASSIVSDVALRSSAFTVGLLSVTDALYHAPLQEIVTELPLSHDVAAALTDGSGPLGDVLAVGRACETGDIDAIESLMPGRLDDVRNAYGDAVRWADSLRRQLQMQAECGSRIRLPQVTTS